MNITTSTAGHTGPFRILAGILIAVALGCAAIAAPPERAAYAVPNDVIQRFTVPNDNTGQTELVALKDHLVRADHNNTGQTIGAFKIDQLAGIIYSAAANDNTGQQIADNSCAIAAKTELDIGTINYGWASYNSDVAGALAENDVGTKGVQFAGRFSIEGAFADLGVLTRHVADQMS